MRLDEWTKRQPKVIGKDYLGNQIEGGYQGDKPGEIVMEPSVQMWDMRPRFHPLSFAAGLIEQLRRDTGLQVDDPVELKTYVPSAGGFVPVYRTPNDPLFRKFYVVYVPRGVFDVPMYEIGQLFAIASQAGVGLPGRWSVDPGVASESNPAGLVFTPQKGPEAPSIQTVEQRLAEIERRLAIS
jgi:hypothetical protein